VSVGSLADRLAARIAMSGPLPVADYVDAALYDETAGFYTVEGRSGRGGDFLTSPEVGPLFGAVLARAVDEWWHAAGRPARWTVVEHGAGPGTLVRAILAAEPECLQTGALTWVAIDRSPAQLTAHPLHPGVRSTTVDVTGPDRETTADLVVANELLDNLPFDIVERTDDGWAQVLVDYVDGARFAAVLGAPVPGVFGNDDSPLHRMAAQTPVGTRLPVQTAAREWLAGVHDRAPGARILVFDYAVSTAELADREGGWLRTFRAHDDRSDWLHEPGSCDITVDIDVDQLQVDHPASTVGTQAAFLRRHGIDELVEEGRAAWRAGAAVGDLAALWARSRIREAEALLDPDAMGGFAALEWSF
jgi:SAM-dependent MidA family methyltransferase